MAQDRRIAPAYQYFLAVGKGEQKPTARLAPQLFGLPQVHRRAFSAAEKAGLSIFFFQKTQGIGGGVYLVCRVQKYASFHRFRIEDLGGFEQKSLSLAGSGDPFSVDFQQKNKLFYLLIFPALAMDMYLTALAPILQNLYHHGASPPFLIS